MPFFQPPLQFNAWRSNRKATTVTSELLEAAASSAGGALLTDCSTYRWKKPLSHLSLSFFTSSPPDYTHGRAKEDFQKLQESACY